MSFVFCPVLVAQEPPSNEKVVAEKQATSKGVKKIKVRKKKLRKKHKTINQLLAESGIFYWHLNFQYINDFQNGNIRASMDDRYTYGVSALFGLNNWDFFFYYRSLTDRYFSKTRIDEVEVGAKYTLGNLLSPDFWHRRSANFNRRTEAQYSKFMPFYLGLNFSANYLYTGNAKGENVQNGLHDLFQVPKVFLEYLPGINTLGFGLKSYFSYTLEVGKLFSHWEDVHLELGTSVEFGLDLGYRETLGMGLKSKLYSGNNYLQFELYLRQMGYFREFAQADTVTRLWQNTYTAPWFAFSSRAGFYQRRIEMSFGSLNSSEGFLSYGFGFGSFEFSWQSLQKKKDFKEPDYSHTFMMGIANTLVLDRFAFMANLFGKLPVALSFLAMRDLSADPRLFTEKSLARKQESVWLLMAHLRPTLNLQRLGYLEFYAGIGLGFVTLQFVVPVDTIFDKVKSRESLQSFAIGGQAGIRWYGLALRREGAVYGIEVALLSVLPFSGMTNNVRFSDVNILIENLRPTFSLFVGVSVLVDL